MMDNYVKADPPMHLGVHTWSHTLQTGKTDLEILGDLGWTMQIIYDLTGSVPMYWRPLREMSMLVYVPSPHRSLVFRPSCGTRMPTIGVSARATVPPSSRPAPHGIGATKASVIKEMTSWATTTNRTGFISLEHETTDQAIDSFKAYHRALKANNWNYGSVPELQGLPYYQNQWNLTSKKEASTASCLLVNPSTLSIRTPLGQRQRPRHQGVRQPRWKWSGRSGFVECQGCRCFVHFLGQRCCCFVDRLLRLQR